MSYEDSVAVWDHNGPYDCDECGEVTAHEVWTVGYPVHTVEKTCKECGHNTREEG